MNRDLFLGDSADSQPVGSQDPWGVAKPWSQWGDGTDQQTLYEHVGTLAAETTVTAGLRADLWRTWIVARHRLELWVDMGLFYEGLEF